MSSEERVIEEVMDFEDEKKHVLKFRGPAFAAVTAFYASKKSFKKLPKKVRIIVEVIEWEV